jgi:hypothetical protein
MNMGFGTCSKVGIARGNRDYIHSIDMINAAPIKADDLFFRFRFHTLATSPGRWVEHAVVKADNPPNAELRLVSLHAERRYDFICLDKNAPLERASEFGFHCDPEQFHIGDDIMTGPLVADYPFWLQMTEIVRVGGAKLFSNRKWLTFSVSGTPRSMQAVPKGAALRLKMVSRRARLNVIGYETNYGATGQIMTTPAPSL